MSDYIPIQQEDEQTELSIPLIEKQQHTPSNPDEPQSAPAWFDLRLSSFLLYFLITIVVVANVACILIISYEVQAVYKNVQGRADLFTDTRDLPRPDPLDGLVRVP